MKKVMTRGMIQKAEKTDENGRKKLHIWREAFEIRQEWNVGS